MPTTPNRFSEEDFADHKLRDFVFKQDRGKYGNVKSLEQKLNTLGRSANFNDFRAVFPKAKKLKDKSLGYGVNLDKGLRLCFQWDKPSPNNQNPRPYNIQITEHYDKQRKRKR